MKSSLERIYWNNTVLDYLYVAGAILLTWLILQIFKRWIFSAIRRLTGRTNSQYDDVLISSVERFVLPYVYILINVVIIKQLNLTPRIVQVLNVAMTVVTVYFAARVFNHVLHSSLKVYMERREEGPARMQQLNGILVVIKVVVWIVGFLFLLDNVGYNVTTVIAGLGVGGIAIALAAQNILSDLFSYFVIFFDKPFEVGDFISMGTASGTVEYIGIKTSRLRSLGGEQLIIPNAELVKSTLYNFKRQQQRRVVLNIKVMYDTTPESLKEIPAILTDAISSKENVKFDRAHLQGLADHFINFEAVYTVLTADYNLHMDTQQAILTDILISFRKKGIEFAMPTQRVYSNEGKEEIIRNIEKENNRI
jgi:small-conductance mechanosensitive channel